MPVLIIVTAQFALLTGRAHFFRRNFQPMLKKKPWDQVLKISVFRSVQNSDRNFLFSGLRFFRPDYSDSEHSKCKFSRPLSGRNSANKWSDCCPEFCDLNDIKLVQNNWEKWRVFHIWMTSTWLSGARFQIFQINFFGSKFWKRKRIENLAPG